MIVAIYTMMGGFLAAAITDVIQGFLLTTFSLLLIPIALHRVGGFAGLHAAVPDFMFNLFGSAATSEYAWYTILAMALANLVSIIAVATGMQTAGSAKNEMTARVGMIGGMFFKRVIMIFWALTGLLAIALYAGRLHDPDLIWGHMTMDLLFPGAIGLMMAGVLSAKMSSLAGSSVSYSALFIRNLYQPFVKPKSDRHLLNVGRVAIGVTLLGGVGVALFIGNLLDLFKYFISLPAIFGAAIWLGFLWRRVTRSAVIAQVFLCFTIYALVPNVFQSLEWARTRPGFLRETRAQTVTITTKAVTEDVAGRPRRGDRRDDPQGAHQSARGHLLREGRPGRSRGSRVPQGRPRPLPRRDLGAELAGDRFLGILQGPAERRPLRLRRALPVRPALPAERVHPARAEGRPRPLLRPGPHARPADPRGGGAGPAARRRALRGGRAPQAQAGLELGDHEAPLIDVLGFGGCWLLVGVIIFLLWLMVNIR